MTAWPDWLRTYAPQTFTGSFASFHCEFWDWYWAITLKRLRGEPLGDEESVFLAIWARGQGKSSNVEWAAIVEGAFFGSGYVLYVSGTQALADSHVASIRERIESERVACDYPHISNPKTGGRRRYNAERKREMWERRFAILRILAIDDDLPHGAQRLLSERFGVHKSVISRDLSWARKNILFDPFIRRGFAPRCSYKRRTVTITWGADDIFREARNVLRLAQKWLKEAEREDAARPPATEKLSKR